MFASVGQIVTDIEDKFPDMDIHTITLVLNGQHGEFDLTVEATGGEFLEDHKWTGMAHRTGGVSNIVKET
jgi:hypothetical protein